MDLLSALMGFLGGGVAAWGIGQFWTNLVIHPVISVRLDEGCFGTMPLYNTKTGEHVHDARFIRLLVKNTGYSTIKDCCGYFTHVAKRTDGGWLLPEQQEVFTAGWAHYPQSTARSIPRGAFFYLDIIQLYLYPSGQRELQLTYFPTTLKKFLSGEGTYKIGILIAADNAKPREVDVEFTYDPQRDQLTPEKGNWESYPRWAVWLGRLRHRWESWWR